MPDDIKPQTVGTYSEIIRLTERLHRRYMDVIRYELSKLELTDIDAVQASLLLTIQDTETSIGELIDRGYFVSSAVATNVHRLIDAGYLQKIQTERAERSMRFFCTEKGAELLQKLNGMELRHADLIGLSPQNAGITRDSLLQLESIWSECVQSAHLDYAKRMMNSIA